MPHWTPAQIPDLTDKTAVVTGANIGLGYETAKALAEHGATVVMACRDENRCQEAIGRLLTAVPHACVVPGRLDLADIGSVRAFAEGFSAEHDTLDILVNNAGVMAPPCRLETVQGFELQMGVNHLGHFALTGLLLPAMLSTPGSRVVTVSSFAHERGTIDLEDLQRLHGYTPYGAYSASKLANLLFFLELDRRLRAAGATAPISTGAHPGFSSTNLQAAGPFLCRRPLTSWLVLAAVRTVGQPAAHGAWSQLYAATAPDVAGGDYFGPRNRVRGAVAPSHMAPLARDEALAGRLWEASKQLTGVDPDAAVAGAGTAAGDAAGYSAGDSTR